MRVLVQWSRENPGDWEELDSADWASLPDKGAPAASARVDGGKGWINALNIQGTVFTADELAVRDLADGSLVVYRRHEGELWQAWRIHPLRPDPQFGQAYNTLVQGFLDEPSPELIRYGKLLPDALYGAHRAAQRPCGWREWTDGVPRELVRNGQLIDQRRSGRWNLPKGTRTWYVNNVALANGIHTGVHELALEDTPAGAVFLQDPDVSQNGSEVITAVTPANTPNMVGWPDGDYRCQIDCFSVNSDVTYGLLDLGSNGHGHFGRVNAAIDTEVEIHEQQEAAFQFSGLRLATTGVISWVTPGAQTDRYEVVIAADRPSGMGAGQITIEVGEADDFADGPWPEIVAGADNAALFGAVF